VSKFGPWTEIASSEIESERCSTAVEAPVGIALKSVLEAMAYSMAHVTKRPPSVLNSSPTFVWR